MPQSRLSGAIVLIAAQAAVLIFGYIAHLWIGNVLGPAPYGIYGIVLSIQSIFGLFLTLGVPVAISRYVAQNEQQAHSVLSQGTRLQLSIGFLVAGAVAFSSPALAYILGDPTLTPYIIFSAGIILAQALYPVYQQFFSGLHRFNRQAMLTFTYASMKLIGALCLIYLIGVYGAFAGFAIGGVLAGILGWYWSRPIVQAHEQTPAQKLPYKAFLSFAGTYVLILVGLQILISLDLFMVKSFLKNNTQAGYYNSAVTLARIPYMLLQALGFVLLPSVSKLTKPGEPKHEAIAFIRDTLRYLIALIVPSVALAATTSKTLLRLFYFGDDYTPAATSLSILMVGLGALAFYLLLSNIIAGAGKAKTSLYITYFLIAVSAVAGTILIPIFGLAGAAAQTTIAALVGLAILSTYTFKVFRIPLPIRSSINVVVASLVAVAPTYFWDAGPFLLFPQYALSGVIYILTLVLLKEVTQQDRIRIASIHPKLSWVAPKPYDDPQI